MNEKEVRIFFGIGGLITFCSGLMSVLSPFRQHLLPYGIDTSMAASSHLIPEQIGLTVLIVGVLMMLSMIKNGFRIPIAIYVCLLKLYMIITIVFLMNQTHVIMDTYKFALFFDSMICLYGAYFLSTYNRDFAE
ncbi:hypothetical protein [Flammeovirga agarivorans]|uniref:DoxX family protein n=1 Tax=Flammeovirga agarivorans TaxID=2726742 RepID=A0A7X8SHH4_9BACT|nr:hypothetical protein [Flammeovirga agarivorans]NLR90237.1 hypothetical protein [Flammeovirga agarivorans]